MILDQYSTWCIHGLTLKNLSNHERHCWTNCAYFQDNKAWIISFAHWVIFHALLPSADFFKSDFSKNSFRNTIKVSNSLEIDQARHFVRPDLGPNCFQRLSEELSSADNFANSLDPNQAQQNIRADLDLNRLTLWWCSEKNYEFWKKSADDKKGWKSIQNAKS